MYQQYSVVENVNLTTLLHLTMSIIKFIVNCPELSE